VSLACTNTVVYNTSAYAGVYVTQVFWTSAYTVVYTLAAGCAHACISSTARCEQRWKHMQISMRQYTNMLSNYTCMHTPLALWARYSSMTRCEERCSYIHKCVYSRVYIPIYMHIRSETNTHAHASRAVGMLVKHGTVRGALKKYTDTYVCIYIYTCTYTFGFRYTDTRLSRCGCASQARHGASSDTKIYKYVWDNIQICISNYTCMHTPLALWARYSSMARCEERRRHIHKYVYSRVYIRIYMHVRSETNMHAHPSYIDPQSRVLRYFKV